MTIIAFDTYKFIGTLKELGIPENQAEAIADAFRTAHVEAELATKSDLQALELALKSEIRELEYRLIIKLGAIMMGAVAVVAALVKLLWPDESRLRVLKIIYCSTRQSYDSTILLYRNKMIYNEMIFARLGVAPRVFARQAALMLEHRGRIRHLTGGVRGFDP